MSEDINCSRFSIPAQCNLFINSHKSKCEFLSILTINIRSVNCNLDSLLIYISRFDFCLDIIVLTECWINANSIIPSIDNYYYCSSKKSLNKNDGIIIYIRNGLQSCTMEPEFKDGNCLVTKIGNEFTIISSYRPPCFSNPAPYLESLDIILRSCSTPNLILTGDINLDTLSENKSTYVLEYLNMLATHSMKLGIQYPTRMNSCIDHFMVKSKLYVHTMVFDELTDHSPILLIMQKTKSCIKSSFVTKSRMNFNEIGLELQSVIWDDFYNINNVNEATEKFVLMLQTVINKNKSVRNIVRKIKPLKPWITPGIVRSLKRRDKIHLNLRKSGNNSQLQEYYKKYRNWCKKITDNLKKEYYQNKINSSMGDLKETWNIVKELCNLQTSKTPSIELLSITNSPIASLNKVNEYFTSVGKELADKTLTKLQVDDKLLAQKATTWNSPVNSFSFMPTDPFEIKTIIAELKNSKTTGRDAIPVFVIKKFSSILCAPIAHICNLSISKGVFPSLFKQATIIPVYKAGDKATPSNYRPISLLPCLSKILEKVVNKRLTKFLETKGLLASTQFGFRQSKSTGDAVLNLTSLLTTYLDQGDKCIGVFLDLKKAFDTVSIPILIARLSNAGIRGIALNWFKDYLTNRSHCVKVENVTSSEALCSYGVPQGSTLGPSLFLIYLNDLCNINIKKADLLMFADDTVVVFHDKTWDSLKYITEEGLRYISSWLEDSLLTLNIEKTKYLSFRISNATNPPPSYSIQIHTYPCNRHYNPLSCNQTNCPVLEKVSSIKYLGVVVDDKLNWKNHISVTVTRIRKLIYIFKNLRNIVGKKLLNIIYKSLGESILRYCICVWGGAGRSFLIDVERAQRAILKVMSKLPFKYPTTALYNITKLLSVRKLYIYECLRRYHRLTVPFLPANKKRRRLHPLPRTHTVFARRHFNYRGPFLYNQLNSLNDTCKLSNNKFKSLVLSWLDNLDYNETENLLAIIS